MDLWQKSVLEVVYVSANHAQVEKTLSAVVSFVVSHPEIQVLDEIQEFI
jgi:uncharacterized protein YlxP (DUF503 family)